MIKIENWMKARVAEITEPYHIDKLIEIGKDGKVIEKLLKNPTDKNTVPSVIPLLAHLKVKVSKFKVTTIPLVVSIYKKDGADKSVEFFLAKMHELFLEVKNSLIENVDCLGNERYKSHIKEIYRLLILETEFNEYSKLCVAAIRKNNGEEDDADDDGPKAG